MSHCDSYSSSHSSSDSSPKHNSAFEIRIDDLRGPAIAKLLGEHLRSMALHSPPESVHALDLDALRAPAVTFWSAWQSSALVGCAALKELSPHNGQGHGEIKSMRTAASHLRRGVAAQLLSHVLEVARQHSYSRLSLETGSADAFAPARRLYARFGFKLCPPFADYSLDPYSIFMTRKL